MPLTDTGREVISRSINEYIAARERHGDDEEALMSGINMLIGLLDGDVKVALVCAFAGCMELMVAFGDDESED